MGPWKLCMPEASSQWPPRTAAVALRWCGLLLTLLRQTVHGLSVSCHLALEPEDQLQAVTKTRCVLETSNPVEDSGKPRLLT